MPSRLHQRARASSRPWVIQTSAGLSSASVAVSSSQSAWSEMISGSSTARWRARGRTRIQPGAEAGNGAGGRRGQRAGRGGGGGVVVLAAEVGLLFVGGRSLGGKE